MAGKAARRARRMAEEADDEVLDEEQLELEADEDDEVARSPRRGGGASIATRFFGWIDQRGKEGSTLRMQGRDALGTYSASVVLVIIPFVFIVANATHHGAKLASPTFQAAGLIFGLLTALSARLENRVLTPLVAIVSVLLTSTQTTAIPHDLQLLSEVDLVVGMALILVLTMRQSRARSVQTADRRAARRQTAGRDARSTQSGRPTGRRGKVVEEPTGPAASRRYTPPKNRSSA